MRLIKVQLEGIRRFEETDALLVSDRLVAVVGPNEAGKTSLLRALDQIDRVDDALPPTIGTRQSATPPKIRALFQLDEADREALDGVPDTNDLRRFWLTRSETGTTWSLEQAPKRDVDARRSLAPLLEDVAKQPAVEAASNDDAFELGEATFDEVRQVSSSDNDTLNDDQRASIARLADEIETVDEPIDDEATDDERSRIEHDQLQRAKFASSLREVAAVEARTHPWNLAVQILRERLPTLVEFDDADRDLKSEYDLAEIDVSAPPAALTNIAALANLDLDALSTAIDEGDHGTVRLSRERANSTLEEFFSESYGQSEVCLQLDTDGSVLRLLVRAEGGEDFVELSERSSGFKWFVALVAFLAHRHAERPIVLIDEIETHLHYAAQADVIDVLSRQKIAEQVIYTTHSAGALPPDLGRGVRAVVPTAGRQRSTIQNSFWTSGPGFTPLLFGLGAATLPFSIPRYLIVADGAADAILLPSLIREAKGLGQLEYRIAPGIANTPPSDLNRLEEEGGRVAFLVDGDDGGRTHKKNLKAAGIPEKRILDLSLLGSDNVTPEDCVKVDLLVDAANAEGEPFWTDKTLTAADLPETGRSHAIELWCDERSLPRPSKVRMAQRLLELAPSDDADPATRPALLNDRGVHWLRDLHDAAMEAMELQSE